MKLHEFHVLQRQSGAQHHGVAVAGAGVRGGGGEIRASIAAGREDRQVGTEAVDRAVVELQADHAAAAALVVHDQVERKELDEEFRAIAQRLAIERVQHRVAGAIGGRASALCRRPFAEVGGHAAEGPLIDHAALGARERHAPMFELINRGGRIAAEIFDRVLVAEPIGTLDGVVHVPLQ